MFKRNLKTTVDIAKWDFSGNNCHFWRGDYGVGPLYLTICINKNNNLPTDEVINYFVCNLFNVKVRSFDDEYFDKGICWTKTFSFSVN